MEQINLAPGMTLPDLLIDTEVYSSVLIRQTTQTGSNPTDINLQSAILPNGGAAHCDVHDVGDVEWWAGRTGRLYDVTVRNVGWQAPDRGHGHGLYTQNVAADGQKIIDTCAFVAGFSLAWKIYTERPISEPCKMANYWVRNSISVGDVNRDGAVIIGGRYQGAEDVVIEDCVFVGTVMLGYLGRNKRVTFRRNLVIGNLDFRPGDDLVVEDNDIVVLAPYRTPGYTHGPGGYGWKAGALTSYANTTVARNRVFTNAPNVAFNGWTFTYARSVGLGVWDTVVLPLADFPATRREYAVPEKGATLVFAYDPAGAAVPAGAKALYPPANPLGWNDSAPSITPLRAEFAVWREEEGTMERIAELEQALAQAQAALTAMQTTLAQLQGEVAALGQQLVTVTAEREAALAEAATFRGVLAGIYTLVAPYPPAA